MHRFGKPLIMQVFKQPEFMSRAGVSLSALLLLHSGGGSAKAEPTTRRSVLLSMRQGPVLVSKLTNVSVKTFASFVRANSSFGLAASTVARLRGARAPF